MDVLKMFKIKSEKYYRMRRELLLNVPVFAKKFVELKFACWLHFSRS